MLMLTDHGKLKAQAYFIELEIWCRGVYWKCCIP